MGKIITRKKEVYYSIISYLQHSTNLTKLRKKLKISKQNLNKYLRKLVDTGAIKKLGRGWYEVNKNNNFVTQYGSKLKQDTTRGHAFIWKIKITKIPKNWDKRIEILNKNKINYKLVGIGKTTPRIKVYGRKVWLCNDHIRIWENKGKSFYGDTAIQSKRKAFDEMRIVMKAIENKLGIVLKPYKLYVVREHYSLIKNELAKYHNERGEIVRISDEKGEWLCIDDSLGMGGELENIGKEALGNHTNMKKWWNEHKKYGFKITPSFLLQKIDESAVMHKNLLELVLEKKQTTTKFPSYIG